MKKLFFIPLLAAGVLATSCSDEWLEAYKLDPTRPSDAPMSTLLPSAQASYAFVQGDVLPRLTGIFIQQMTGIDRQSLAHNRYVQIGEGDFDTPWGNSYAGGMYDLKLIIEKADALDAPAYRGVAKITMAMYLGTLTDHFGDIPYSEALAGAGNLKPKFDSQESIYAEIARLLQEGSADLDLPSSVSPKGDDLIHGGDLAKWKATAAALGARYLNHLSKKSSYAPQSVIAAADAALAVGAYTRVPFQSAAQNQNPWHQFTVIERDGYISQHGTMFGMMRASNDPRIPIYRSADSAYLPFYGAATADLPIITDFELMFIKAEAQLALGATSDARASLEAAIAANMAYLGVDAAAAQAYIAALPGTTNLELVMNEKYIAMYTHVESWTDWRRTGFPNISAPAGANLNEVPRRMPYPESEYLYNSANVPMPITSSPAEKFGVDATYPLWWDKN
ncbi:MAG: SusD/RagB family nutrient-binding outer membrane lipoprotein [Schleiferiaceae bacterium]